MEERREYYDVDFGRTALYVTPLWKCIDENVTPEHQNAYLRTYVMRIVHAAPETVVPRSCKTIPLPFLGLGSLPRFGSPTRSHPGNR